MIGAALLGSALIGAGFWIGWQMFGADWASWK